MSIMETKFFEIRDRGTFIGVVAQSFDLREIPKPDENIAERFILKRGGFGGSRFVILTKISPEIESQYDSFSWSGSPRTMPTAHQHIEKHWSALTSGDVIDVQYILGETTEKKTSERLEGVVIDYI